MERLAEGWAAQVRECPRQGPPPVRGGLARHPGWALFQWVGLGV